MSKTPRQRAEACFAVARSTTHAGERQSAIGRGEAICAKHDLPLDDFEIPGRRRQSRRPERTASAAAASASTTYASYSARSIWQEDVSIEELLAGLTAAMTRARARAGATEYETAYDAMRRNFDAAAAAAKERDRLAELKRRAREVSNELSRRGYGIYDAGPDQWFVVYQGATGDLTNQELLDYAEQLGIQPSMHRRAA